MFACDSVEPTELNVYGRVYVSGNEPFTKLTLEAESGYFYLESTEEIESYLWDNQDKFFNLIYRPINEKTIYIIKVL